MHTNFTVEQLLLDDTFLDYCNNENSAHRKVWEEIISGSSADQKKIIQEARDLLLLLNPSLTQEDIATEVNKLRNRIKQGEIREQPVASDQQAVSQHLYVTNAGELRRKKMRKVLLMCIGAAVLITGAAYYLNSLSDKVKEPNRISYKSSRAQRKVIELPDGSTVTLNANSSIEVSEDYNSANREVTLLGDAFFNVSKDASKPFVVISPDFTTTALGTSFYVRRKNEGRDYSVELLEGRVRLTPNKKPNNAVTLDAGEMALWQDSYSSFKKDGFDTSGLKQWLRGTITFKETPLREAIRQLSDWYSVPIEVQSNDLGTKTISGNYANVPIDDVLKVICFTLSASYSYSNDRIIIK